MNSSDKNFETSLYFKDVVGRLWRRKLDGLGREVTLRGHTYTPRANRRVPFIITHHPRLPNFGRAYIRTYSPLSDYPASRVFPSGKYFSMYEVFRVSYISRNWLV